MNKNKFWADCTICNYFQIIGVNQKCNKIELTGLPNKFAVGTTKKYCSEFSTEITNFKIPNKSKMEEGVLYFYNPKKPSELIEDIDL